MARMARAVVPSLPHHITQRGNRRQPTFFSPGDYLAYRRLAAEWCRHFHVEVWAYCLMPNHVHLVVVPESADSLRRAIGEAHRRYTAEINRREGWTGHLWQGRFASFVMDERHTLAAARYVELNPVRAGLVSRVEDYPWSSARAHLLRRDDSFVKVAPLLALAGDWASFLGGATAEEPHAFRRHERTGRPLGSDAFIGELERVLGRVLRKRRPGPAPKGDANARRANKPLPPEFGMVSPEPQPLPPELGMVSPQPAAD
jgi:putative transposase